MFCGRQRNPPRSHCVGGFFDQMWYEQEVLQLIERLSYEPGLAEFMYSPVKVVLVAPTLAKLRLPALPSQAPWPTQ